MHLYNFLLSGLHVTLGPWGELRHAMMGKKITSFTNLPLKGSISFIMKSQQYLQYLDFVTNRNNKHSHIILIVVDVLKCPHYHFAIMVVFISANRSFISCLINKRRYYYATNVYKYFDNKISMELDSFIIPCISFYTVKVIVLRGEGAVDLTWFSREFWHEDEESLKCEGRMSVRLLMNTHVPVPSPCGLRVTEMLTCHSGLEDGQRLLPQTVLVNPGRARL